MVFLSFCYIFLFFSIFFPSLIWAFWIWLSTTKDFRHAIITGWKLQVSPTFPSLQDPQIKWKPGWLSMSFFLCWSFWYYRTLNQDVWYVLFFLILSYHSLVCSSSCFFVNPLIRFHKYQAWTFFRVFWPGWRLLDLEYMGKITCRIRTCGPKYSIPASELNVRKRTSEHLLVSPFSFFKLAVFTCSRGYAQTLILVNSTHVKSISRLVITSYCVGATAWKFDRLVHLCLLYLPIPIRTRNVSYRPQMFSPEVFKKKTIATITLKLQYSWI